MKTLENAIMVMNKTTGDEYEGECCLSLDNTHEAEIAHNLTCLLDKYYGITNKIVTYNKMDEVFWIGENTYSCSYTNLEVPYQDGIVHQEKTFYSESIEECGNHEPYMEQILRMAKDIKTSRIHKELLAELLAN